VRSYRTFSPLPRHRAWPPTHLRRTNPGTPFTRRDSRGGMFSVALAVCGPSSPHPGRYPAHYPAEFGLPPPGRKNPRQRPPGPFCHGLFYRQKRLTSPPSSSSAWLCGSFSSAPAVRSSPHYKALAGCRCDASRHTGAQLARKKAIPTQQFKLHWIILSVKGPHRHLTHLSGEMKYERTN
jgi:hypothetical protein